VRYKSDPRMVITKMEKLDGGTVLNLKAVDQMR